MELLKGLLLVALVAIASASLQQSRIVGGEAAESDEFTYQVSLRSERTRTHFCSGAILTSRWIITSSQCVHTKVVNEYYAVYGARRLSEAGQTTKIAEVVNHPKYDPLYLENDLALLFTKSKIVFIHDVVDPIALPMQASHDGDVAIVSGWGITERVDWPQQKNFSDIIQFHVTKLISINECKKLVGVLASTIHDEKTICTETPSLDLGDDGNPLVSATRLRQLIGVISSVNSYADNAPDVYTAVFPYVSWIKKYIYKYD